MTKAEFLSELKNRLSSLPDQDVKDRLDFYSEIIDDRIEDGESEEEAVRSLGSMDDIVAKIMEETPLPRIVKKKVKSKQPSGCAIALIILGIPVWLPILIALLGVVLSVYAVLWALVLTVLALAVALVISTVALFGAGVVFLFTGRAIQGLFIIGGVMVCAGLGVLAVLLVKYAVKGAVFLGKRAWLGIKYLIAGMR